MCKRCTARGIICEYAPREFLRPRDRSTNRSRIMSSMTSTAPRNNASLVGLRESSSLEGGQIKREHITHDNQHNGTYPCGQHTGVQPSLDSLLPIHDQQATHRVGQMRHAQPPLFSGSPQHAPYHSQPSSISTSPEIVPFSEGQLLPFMWLDHPLHTSAEYTHQRHALRAPPSPHMRREQFYPAFVDGFPGFQETHRSHPTVDQYIKGHESGVSSAPHSRYALPTHASHEMFRLPAVTISMRIQPVQGKS